MHPLEIFFGNDQKSDFKPCHCYFQKLNNCAKAYKKIVNDKSHNLTRNEIFLWLKENSDLYNEIKREYLMFRYRKFRILYTYLKSLDKEFMDLSDVKKTINKLNKIEY